MVPRAGPVGRKGRKRQRPVISRRLASLHNWVASGPRSRWVRRAPHDLDGRVLRDRPCISAISLASTWRVTGTKKMEDGQ